MKKFCEVSGIFALTTTVGFSITTCDSDTNNNNDPNKGGPEEVLASEHYYNSDGSLRNYAEYKYDSKGNLTKWSGFNANGVLDSYEENEYDSKGNMTKYSYCYDESGELSLSMLLYTLGRNCKTVRSLQKLYWNNCNILKNWTCSI